MMPYNSINKLQQAVLDNNFTYHKPFGDQTERYERIRDTAKSFASLAIHCTPICREQSIALTNLEQAVFWFNAAIARNEKEDKNEAEVENNQTT